MSARTYLDADGREYFVVMGPGAWSVMSRLPAEWPACAHVTELPARATYEEAQADLDAYARANGFQAVGETEPEKGVTHLPAPRTIGTEDALITDIEVDTNIREVTAVKPEFVDSIRDHGVIEPLIVTLTGSGCEKPLRLVAGHRRLLGAQEAGLERVPCQVRDLTPRQIAEFRFVENIHREDLTPLEEARAMRDLAEKHGLKQSEIARIRGKSQEWVSNRIRLLTLPDPIQDLIRQGILSASAALETHRLIRYPDLAARLAIELAGSTCHPDKDSPVSVAVVRDRVYWALLGAGKDLGGQLSFAGCETCETREDVYKRRICMDPACPWWTRKRPAQGLSPAQPELKAAESPPVADAPPAPGYLPRPLRECPAGCPDIKDGLCGKPKSDCRKSRVLATQAVAERELAESEERDRVKRAELAEIRARHLGRVESYLRHRIASNQKGFSHPEMRLASLALLEGESGLDYVAAVLGGVFIEHQHHASTAEGYSEALLGLSTRTLTTLAVGYLLLGADGYLSDPGCALANTIAINVGLAPEPEDGVTLDAARLVNPAGAEADPQTDPEPGGDPNHDPEPGEALPIAEALGDDGEAVLETGPDSEIPGHVEETVAEPSPYGPNPAVTQCAERGLPMSPAECLACCREGKPPCCPLVLAAGHAPFHCPGGLGACPTFQAESGPAADQPELAPLELAKADYGANPAVKKCPLPGELAIVDNPEACLICCSSQRGATKRCCRAVTSGAAPFHCPGGLDVCPASVGGEPAPITVCPASKDATTEAECKVCCTGNRPDSGCCVWVLAGKGPSRCPGPAICPEATVPAAEEETVPFVTEAGATCGPCPARDGKPVTETECRTCNEERQTSALGCCDHVISGQAPFRCQVCERRTGCQTAAARGVE